MQQRKTPVSVVFSLGHLKACTFLDRTTFFSLGFQTRQGLKLSEQLAYNRLNRMN